MSEISIASSGTIKASCLRVKYAPAKRDIAVMGAKFGGCGTNLVSAAIKTKLKSTFSFFESVNIELAISIKNNHFFYTEEFVFLHYLCKERGFYKSHP